MPFGIWGTWSVLTNDFIANINCTKVCGCYSRDMWYPFTKPYNQIFGFNCIYNYQLHLKVTLVCKYMFKLESKELEYPYMPNSLPTPTSFKVCMFYFNEVSNWTPIFDWCVVKQGSENKHCKDTCLKDRGSDFNMIFVDVSLWIC